MKLTFPESERANNISDTVLTTIEKLKSMRKRRREKGVLLVPYLSSVASFCL